jgi:hypothetical protein
MVIPQITLRTAMNVTELVASFCIILCRIDEKDWNKINRNL